MISRYFIDRPIFASVLSIAIALAGGISLRFLPVAQYPRITPPGVSISISYPGASAQDVADTVGAPIEQLVNGVPGMLYMSSQSGNDGSYSLTVTFDIGTDIKTALVMVQNRVTLALPQLPSSVQNQGITIRKRTPDMLMIVNFTSPNGRYDDKYLSNYATIHVKDEMLRVDGVSDITVQGQRDYSMRVWLDPQKLAAKNITALDVADAIRNENTDAPAGRIGQPPIRDGQSFQLPLDTLGRLADPEQFGAIVVKTGASPPALTSTGKYAQTAAVVRNPAAPGGGPLASSLSTSSASSTSTAASGTTTTASSTATADTSTATPDSGSNLPADSPLATPNPTSYTPDVNSATVPGSTAMGSNSGSTAAASTDTSGGSVGAAGLTGGALGTGGMPTASTPIVRLRDLARIELGAQNYNTLCYFDGRPAVGLGLYQLPGTNALDVASRVRARMEELKKDFPEDLEYVIGYDTTTFVSDSVNDVKATLLLALALVAVVVLVFLQSWRASIIPLVAVPVSIIGTFSAMAVLGYSLNNISLFGLVLAIGIVVDDAIVVVENVERWLDRGLSSREATRRAMDEVTSPIIAVALVLCAVFVPCAFISGITGQFFRQFAVTIAVSTLFSTLNSLTLSPALAAILLRPRHAKRDIPEWVLFVAFGWFFWLFNRAFGFGTNAYGWAVGILMRASLLVLPVYLALLVLTVVVFQRAPKGFIPSQDMGRLIVNVQLPDSSSMERTIEATTQVTDILLETEGVAHVVGNCGTSFIAQANSPNFASMFVVLKPFDERQKPWLTADAIMNTLREKWDKRVKDADVMVLGSSPVPGLGVAGGFKFLVEDRSGTGVVALQQQVDQLTRKLKEVPGLKAPKTQFRARTPQLFAEIDRAKCASLGVALADVNQTLDMLLGSLYVNSYNAFGRHWQVTVQAEQEYRSKPGDIALFQVRNSSGQMVPLSTLVKLREIGGPISVTRYNLYTAASISGGVENGFSDGDVIKAVDALTLRELPLSMKTEWTELTFLQIRAGSTAIYVFLLAVISVFLALSALYESWTLPLAVILVVPLCLLCSVEGVVNTGRDVNIFVQIGLVVLVGLACKNAILIVEFAKQLHDEGKSRYDATKEASKLRLRPILMTSFAFIFGVFPLVVASGAGQEMRKSLGIAVFTGMLGVTLFGIFLTPVFFYVIQGMSESKSLQSPRVRALLTYTMGFVLGGAAGFAIGRLGAGLAIWTAAIGAVLGILLVRGVRGFRVAPAPMGPQGPQGPPPNSDSTPPDSVAADRS